MNVTDKTQPGDQLWTIPNFLSILRILLIIPIVHELKLATEQSYLTAFFLIAAAYLTDFLDGFLARLLKSISKIGQILDPIGDKLLAITVSALLYFDGRAPLYFFTLVLLRDLIISLGAIYVFNSRRMIVLPMLMGKVTTLVLGLVLCSYALRYSTAMGSLTIRMVIVPVVQYGTWLASALLLLSGSFYVFYYGRSLFGPKTPRA